MTELNNLILKLISQRANVNEISEITKLSNKQLYYRLSLLQFKGYVFKRRYYDNGDIGLYIDRTLKGEEDIIIKTDINNNEFSALFISDLHFCSKYDRVDLVNKIYDFCINNNLHCIFNAGDFLEGPINKFKNLKNNLSDNQIEYLLKNYPFDKNILNFICFGNHDAAYLNSSGQNVAKALENKRYDLCPVGFDEGKIIVKDDCFYLTHPNTFEKTIPDYDIVFQGHHHKIKTHTNGRNLMFYLPTLSDIGLQTHGTFPGFSMVKFVFDNGIINEVYIQNYNFINKKIRLTSENEFILNDRKLFINQENKKLELINKKF